jgi:hypothetical protein
MHSSRHLRVTKFFAAEKEPKQVLQLVTAIMRGSRNKMIQLACKFKVEVMTF